MQMNSFKRTAVSLALLASAFAAGSAHAAYTTTLDVAGIDSNAEFGSLDNVTRYLDLFAGAWITGIAWDVVLTTNGTSWLSEMSVDVNDGDALGASLAPAFATMAPGTGSFSGSQDLTAIGADFRLGASGRLFFQFFEGFDDFIGATDGTWTRGTLTVSYVPEPASFGLAALGLLGLGAMSRRRSK